MEILTRQEIDKIKKESLRWVTTYLRETSIFDADGIQKKWDRLVMTCDSLTKENTKLQSQNRDLVKIANEYIEHMKGELYDSCYDCQDALIHRIDEIRKILEGVE